MVPCRCTSPVCWSPPAGAVPTLDRRPKPCSRRGYSGYGPQGTRPSLLERCGLHKRAGSVGARLISKRFAGDHPQGNGGGRIRQAPRAATTSVGRSAQIPRNIAGSGAARQCTDREGPEGHEARLPSSGPGTLPSGAHCRKLVQPPLGPSYRPHPEHDDSIHYAQGTGAREPFFDLPLGSAHRAMWPAPHIRRPVGSALTPPCDPAFVGHRGRTHQPAGVPCTPRRDGDFGLFPTYRACLSAARQPTPLAFAHCRK